jgi:uncharacterized protein HemX
MKLSDSTSVSMPMRNLLAICAAIAIGTMSFFTLQERITTLETRATLFETDLLKKAEQTPINQELYMLSEWLANNQEKIQTEMESMMNNRVNIDFLKKQVDKLQKDVEELKDKVRNNGSN